MTMRSALSWIDAVQRGLVVREEAGPLEREVFLKFRNAFAHYFDPLTTTVNNTTKAAVLDPSQVRGVLFLSNLITPTQGLVVQMSANLQEGCWARIVEEAALLHQDVLSDADLDEADDADRAQLQQRSNAIRTIITATGQLARLSVQTDRAGGCNTPVLQWWKDHPQFTILYPAVKGVLQIPVSAAKPERLFSYTRWLITRLTSLLNADSVENRAIIHDAMETGVLTPELLADYQAWAQAQ